MLPGVKAIRQGSRPWHLFAGLSSESWSNPLNGNELISPDFSERPLIPKRNFSVLQTAA
jgi:hypothetical protein